MYESIGLYALHIFAISREYFRAVGNNLPKMNTEIEFKFDTKFPFSLSHLYCVLDCRYKILPILVYARSIQWND